MADVEWRGEVGDPDLEFEAIRRRELAAHDKEIAERMLAEAREAGGMDAAYQRWLATLPPEVREYIDAPYELEPDDVWFERGLAEAERQRRARAERDGGTAP